MQGEDAAILGTVGALTDCLQRPGGCAVVPGIPSDQYTLTVITSLVGGVVFGYSLRLEPSGTTKLLYFHVHRVLSNTDYPEPC